MRHSFCFLFIGGYLCCASSAVAKAPKVSSISSTLTVDATFGSKELSLRLKEGVECRFEREWAWGRYTARGPCVPVGDVARNRTVVVQPETTVIMGAIPTPFNRVRAEEFQVLSSPVISLKEGRESREVAANFRDGAFFVDYSTLLGLALRRVMLAPSRADEVLDFTISNKSTWASDGRSGPFKTSESVGVPIGWRDFVGGACVSLSGMSVEQLAPISKGLTFKPKAPGLIKQACPSFGAENLFCEALDTQLFEEPVEAFTARTRFCSTEVPEAKARFAGAGQKLVDRLGSKAFISTTRSTIFRKNLESFVEASLALKDKRSARATVDEALKGYGSSRFLSRSSHFAEGPTIEPVYASLLGLAKLTKSSTKSANAQYSSELTAYLAKHTPGKGSGMAGVDQLEDLGRLVNTHSHILSKREASILNGGLATRLEEVVQGLVVSPPKTLDNSPLVALSRRLPFASPSRLSSVLKKEIQPLISKESIPDQEFEVFLPLLNKAWVKKERATWANRNLKAALESQDLARTKKLLSVYKAVVDSSLKKKAEGWVRDQTLRNQYISTIKEGDRIARSVGRRGFQTTGLAAVSTADLASVAKEAGRLVEAKRQDDRAKAQRRQARQAEARDRREAAQREQRQREYARRQADAAGESICSNIQVKMLNPISQYLTLEGASYENSKCYLVFYSRLGARFSGVCQYSNRSMDRVSLSTSSSGGKGLMHIRRPGLCDTVIITNMGR